MKTKILAAAGLAWLLSFVCALAAPLTETTAVHAKPDATSPALGYLKAGTEPTPAPKALADTPAGWMPVELPGPFEAYVLTKDFTKGLDVKPGAPIRLAPELTAGVLKAAERGDNTTITGLRGRWTQISLRQPLVGYIHLGTGAPSAAIDPARSASDIPFAAPPPPVAAENSNQAGQPAMQSSAADRANLPRQLTGKFVSTRSVFHPRRPYDWALVDNTGKRFAYLDISKLLLTDAIEKYIDHFVVVFGAAKPTGDGKDIVIQVESLQLLLR